MKTAKRWTALFLALVLALGSLALNAQAGQINNDGTFTNSSSGTINNTGTLNNTGTFSNDGRIAHFYEGTHTGAITGATPVNRNTGTSGGVSYAISGSVLTISGTGAMADYGGSAAPWYGARGRVRTIVIGNGVTYIGAGAFSGFDVMFDAAIPVSVTGIGTGAFYYCYQASFTYAGSTDQWGQLDLEYGALPCWRNANIQCSDGVVSMESGTITAASASSNWVTVDGVRYSDAAGLAAAAVNGRKMSYNVDLYLVDGQIVNYAFGEREFYLSDNGTDGKNGFEITCAADDEAPGCILSSVPAGMEQERFLIRFYDADGGWEQWDNCGYSDKNRFAQWNRICLVSARIYRWDTDLDRPTGDYLANWTLDTPILVQSSYTEFPNAADVSVLGIGEALDGGDYRYIFRGLDTSCQYWIDDHFGGIYANGSDSTWLHTDDVYPSFTLTAATGSMVNGTYVVSWSLPQAFDVEFVPDYAVVLERSIIGAVKISENIYSEYHVSLLHMDGMIEYISVFTNSPFSTDADDADIGASGVINVGDIVTYTVDADGIYTFTLFSDAKEYSSGAPITRNGTANLNGSTGLRYGLNNASTYAALANEKTIFALCDPASRSTRVYYGIAQAPDVTVGETPIRVSVVPSDGGDYAEFVFIQVADDTISPYTNACGDDLTWALDEGVLTISGTGHMYSYDFEDVPWYQKRATICSVVVEEGVIYISDSAFRDCPNLTSVSLPNTVEVIGMYAFQDCSSLESIALPARLREIYGAAFDGCTALKTLHIPAGLNFISNAPFTHCDNLESITVASENTSFKAVDDVLFSYDGTELVSYAAGKAGTSYTVPEGVRTIRQGAFSYSKLAGITLPEGIEMIDSSAFEICAALETITLPASLQVLGAWAFVGCRSLMSLAIPSGIETIEPHTFVGCEALGTVYIPESVTEIAPYAFAGTSLTTIHYAGSPSQWKDIQIAENGNEALTALTPGCAKSD